MESQAKMHRCEKRNVSTWSCLRQLMLWVSLTPLMACFGTVNEPVRRYYTLHLEPLKHPGAQHFPGLLRVRDLDSEAAYDRFQIVIRRSPFELSYRQKDVWAVKPQRMLSDLIARGLTEQGLFSSVTRELGERRPNYLLSGELHAIEVYDSQDTWFAHLAMGWQISDFETGRILWTYNYDDRKNIPANNVAHAVRAISELLTRAIDMALYSLQNAHFSDAAPPAYNYAPFVPTPLGSDDRSMPPTSIPPNEPVPVLSPEHVNNPNVQTPPHIQSPAAPLIVPEPTPEVSPLRQNDVDKAPLDEN